MQVQQVEFQNKDENDEMAVEVYIFMIRFVDILNDIVDWKEKAKFSYGDVRNSEADVVLRSVKKEMPGYERYLINVTRSLAYMTSSIKRNCLFTIRRWKAY